MCLNRHFLKYLKSQKIYEGYEEKLQNNSICVCKFSKFGQEMPSVYFIFGNCKTYKGKSEVANNYDHL